MTGVSFIDAVAGRSGHPAQDVADLLEAARVPTADTVGAPSRLRVTRLAFTGEKAGVSTGAFGFDQQFGNGLWALTSEKNERGKTSILEIMMWALRGQRKSLQDDVRSWLRTVALEGVVEGEKFVVEFELVDGEPEGALECSSGRHPFSSEAAFADTMAKFMMDKLGFDPFPQWVKDQGVSTHGWLLYSTALYMPHGVHQAVIGDKAEAGLAQRLLQLFVGVPWTQTSIACQAALKQAQAAARDQQGSRQAVQRAVGQVVEQRQQELEYVRQELAKLPEGLPSDEQVEAARSAWMGLIDLHGEAEIRQREAARDADAARLEVTRRRKQHTDMAEAALAERLFQGLNPTSCPRCLTPIDAERKQAEADTHECAVCTHLIDLDLHTGADAAAAEGDKDEPATLDGLWGLVVSAEEAAAAERTRFEERREQAGSLARELAEAKSQVDAHAAHTAQIQQRRTLETRIASLEAVISEVGNLGDGASALSSLDPRLDFQIEVLRAAEEEAKQRVRDESADVMGQINRTILELAQRFGFENLQRVQLDFAARLKLTKGGIDGWFSKQTPGEKLRLRIAVTIALLRVAHQDQRGRHPGLLLIDSIGAEETEPGDLASFMRELSAVAAETGIEIIVASARPEILEHVPEGNRISAEGEDYLW
ncbi:MAG: hypothetical protein OXN79_11655 [bacterium]|nr:hypothetical protein [bacterium]MDE0217216.1 hypothetical protein [bacterium]